MEAPSEELKRELRAWAERTIGPIAELEDRSRAFGRMSLVWRLETVDGGQFYLKRHEARLLYERELTAVRDWLPLLPEGARQMTVPMVATADELDAVIFEAAPGEIVEEAELTSAELHAAYQMAGAFAAALHALPCEGCGAAPGYEQELVGKIEGWFELYEGVEGLDEELRRFVLNAVVADGVFRDAVLVPTHMDYSPRNWLLHREDGALWLHVIDWERARPELWVQDVARVAEDHWQRDPALREAFFLGYGREPSEIEARQLKLLSLANMVPTIGWARAREDHRFEGWAREVLGRLHGELVRGELGS
ncbi:MAG: phosphotransferase [Dehalococcoidia bacterium]|nr:phosphotransferase [Dehalococcoidia bacterium]